MLKLFQKLNGDLRQDGFATLVALGDSVTQGCFESSPAQCDYTAVYHNQLKLKLNSLFRQPLNVINAGIGGDNAPGGAARLERDVLSHHPDLVTVCYGLNDVHGEKENYLNALEEIFTNLKEAGVCTIFMTPNMMNTRVLDSVPEGWLRDTAHRTAEIQNNGRMDEYISEAIALAKRMDVPVCDCYTIWKQMEAAGVDISASLANGINHPNRELHQLFANELLKTLLALSEAE